MKKKAILFLTALMLMNIPMETFADEDTDIIVEYEDESEGLSLETETDSSNDEDGALMEDDVDISIASIEVETAPSEMPVSTGIVASGTCGEELSWSLDDSGTLTISGSGVMTDYSETDYAPWYSNCNLINELVVEDGVTYIGTYAFYNCSKITKASLPDSLTEIGYYGFGKCKSLTGLSFPDSLISIGDWAFYECTSLSSITIPGNVDYMGNYAFGCCTGLTSINISEGVSAIGGDVFNNCTGLKSITFPESLTSIGGCAFADCTSLTDITFSDNIRTIDSGAFMGCSSLTSVTLPQGLVSLGQSAFIYCSGLTDITFPDGILNIGVTTFLGCSNLSSVTIPDSVVLIGEGAFEDCSSLNDIYYSGSIENWNLINIEERNENIAGAVIHCSDGVVTPDLMSAYSATLAYTYCVYDGTAKEPAVSVSKGNILLSEGVDYEVSYSNNISAGNATVLITGIGNYTGSIAEKFEIAAVNLDECEVTLSAYAYTYDGSAKTPAVTVKNASTVFKKGTDYTVVYNDNVAAGIVMVDVEGIGSCEGNVTREFIIKKADPTINISAAVTTVVAGNTIQISASTTGDGEVSYASDNVSVMTVDSNGLISGIRAGTSTIYVSTSETDNYHSATESISITVTKVNQTLTASTAASSIVAGKTTRISASGKGTITYTSSNTNIAKVSSSGVVTGVGAGTATITVKAAGTSTYNSASTSVTIKVTLATGKISSLTNTSKGITVKWNKVTGASGYYIYRSTKSGKFSSTPIKTITSGSTVTYTDTAVKNKNGTTYYYKVVPYSGSTKGTGTQATTVRLKAVSLSSVKNTASKKITVKWNKTTKVTGYQIQYSKSKTFSSGNKTVKISGASKVSKAISKLTKNKTYYVRIRTYKTVNGKTYYSAWSSKKTVKITK